MRNDIERLNDIVDSINIIEKSLSNNVKLHELNELEYLGIIRCIEMIGEASRALTESFKDKYPEIAWRQIANMRNILVHQYFEVDEEKVVKVVEEHLPKLKIEIEKIIKDL